MKIKILRHKNIKTKHYTKQCHYSHHHECFAMLKHSFLSGIIFPGLIYSAL